MLLRYTYIYVGIIIDNISKKDEQSCKYLLFWYPYIDNIILFLFSSVFNWLDKNIFLAVLVRYTEL